MSDIATSPSLPPTRIRWTWDLGPDFADVDIAGLMAVLAAVGTYGTLAAAAQAAGTSYRSAWGLLRRCETALGRPLVVKARGRGTSLSELGALLLELDGAARTTLSEFHAPWENRLRELLAPAAPREPVGLRVAASHDLALADWIENARRFKLDLFWRGSEEALAALARDECDVAGFHVPEAWSSSQVNAWLGRWLKPRQHVCIAVMRRRHGLLTAGGNPHGVRSVADAARLGLRMVNRQRGSGTRSMIDQLLAANGLSAEGISGYAHEEFTHDAVAATIASGQADVGFGIQAVADRYDLDFIPLTWDRYGLALRGFLARSPAVLDLLRRFDGNTFRQRLAAMPGYESLPLGEPRPWEEFAQWPSPPDGTAPPSAG